jgi:hypothetical protein
LKPKCDEALSNFDYNFNLRRYNWAGNMAHMMGKDDEGTRVRRCRLTQ